MKFRVSAVRLEKTGLFFLNCEIDCYQKYLYFNNKKSLYHKKTANVSTTIY